VPGTTRKKLDDMVMLETGSRPEGGVSKYDGGVPSVGAEHLAPGGRFDFTRIKYVPERFYASMGRGRIRARDVLLVKDGATIGKASLVTPAFPFARACVNEHVFILRPKTPGLLRPEYLFYFLSTPGAQARIRQRISGSAQGGLTQQSLRSLAIAVPSPGEQDRIASILSNVDAVIENAEKRIAHYGRLKSSLMTSLLSPCVQTLNNAKAKRSICDMLRLDKHAGSWAPVPLFQLCEVNGDTDVGSTIYVGLEHIVPRENSVLTTGHVDDFKTHRPFQKNSILYGKLRPELNKVWLATCDGHCSVDILVLSLCPKTIVPAFLLYSLTCSKFVKLAVSLSSGTKMPRTSWSSMKNINFLIPPLKTQRRIASILSGVDAVLENHHLYKKRLERLKKGLMQKLLTS